MSPHYGLYARVPRSDTSRASHSPSSPSSNVLSVAGREKPSLKVSS